MHELNILLKIEFRRAFKNKLFAASIVIGLALAAGAFIQTVVPHIDVLGGYDGSVASYPHSVFTSWMGIGIGYDIWATVYLYVCILLAALPYCSTFVKDNNSQYILQYYSRISKNRLHIAKFITTFVVGGLIVVIPLLVNLIATMMFVPALKPIENGLFMGNGSSFMNVLFVKHTFIYTFIYIVQFFIYGGAFCVIALASSYIFNNSFLVMLMPFVTFYGLGVVSNCKLIVLCISSIAIVICAVMIIRINVLYPNAEVISYTKDNPVDINGLEVKPIDYSVYTLDEFSEISSEYDRYLKRENKDKN